MDSLQARDDRTTVTPRCLLCDRPCEVEEIVHVECMRELMTTEDREQAMLDAWTEEMARAAGHWEPVPVVAAYEPHPCDDCNQMRCRCGVWEARQEYLRGPR